MANALSLRFCPMKFTQTKRGCLFLNYITVQIIDLIVLACLVQLILSYAPSYKLFTDCITTLLRSLNEINYERSTCVIEI